MLASISSTFFLIYFSTQFKLKFLKIISAFSNFISQQCTWFLFFLPFKYFIVVFYSIRLSLLFLSVFIHLLVFLLCWTCNNACICVLLAFTKLSNKKERKSKKHVKEKIATMKKQYGADHETELQLLQITKQSCKILVVNYKSLKLI